MDGEVAVEQHPYYSLDSLKNSMRNVEFPWVLGRYCKKKTEPLVRSIQDSLGLMDWCLNGEISRAALRGQMKENTLALFANFPNKKKSSFLLYCSSEQLDKNPQHALKTLITSLQKLKVKNLHLLESSWPEAFLEELKNSLSIAGIEFSSLEENSWKI